MRKELKKIKAAENIPIELNWNKVLSCMWTSESSMLSGKEW